MDSLKSIFLDDSYFQLFLFAVFVAIIMAIVGAIFVSVVAAINVVSVAAIAVSIVGASVVTIISSIVISGIGKKEFELLKDMIMKKKRENHWRTIGRFCKRNNRKKSENNIM